MGYKAPDPNPLPVSKSMVSTPMFESIPSILRCEWNEDTLPARVIRASFSLFSTYARMDSESDAVEYSLLVVVSIILQTDYEAKYSAVS